MRASTSSRRAAISALSALSALGALGALGCAADADDESSRAGELRYDAAGRIGDLLPVVVTNALQTSAGRMVFARPSVETDARRTDHLADAATQQPRATNFRQEIGVDKTGNAVDAGAADQWLLPQRRRLEPGWQLPDVEPVPGQGSLAEAEVRAVHYDWVGTEARLAGTIVHRWLQFAAQSGEGAAALFRWHQDVSQG